MRLCGDFKVTVNPALKTDQYPLPIGQKTCMLATLAGGQYFSKLDLAQAYLQVLLDKESRKYVTVNTHQGLYQYKRLPFGISIKRARHFPANNGKCPTESTRHRDLFRRCLVTGKTKEEHLQNLEAVFTQLSEHGLKLKKKKCSFMKTQVE